MRHAIFADADADAAHVARAEVFLPRATCMRAVGAVPGNNDDKRGEMRSVRAPRARLCGEATRTTRCSAYARTRSQACMRRSVRKITVRTRRACLNALRVRCRRETRRRQDGRQSRATIRRAAARWPAQVRAPWQRK